MGFPDLWRQFINACPNYQRWLWVLRREPVMLALN